MAIHFIPYRYRYNYSFTLIVTAVTGNINGSDCRYSVSDKSNAHLCIHYQSITSELPTGLRARDMVKFGLGSLNSSMIWPCEVCNSRLFVHNGCNELEDTEQKSNACCLSYTSFELVVLDSFNEANISRPQSITPTLYVLFL